MPGRSSGVKQEPAPENEEDMMEQDIQQDQAPSGPLGKRVRRDEEDEDEDSEVLHPSCQFL